MRLGTVLILQNTLWRQSKFFFHRWSTVLEWTKPTSYWYSQNISSLFLKVLLLPISFEFFPISIWPFYGMAECEPKSIFDQYTSIRIYQLKSYQTSIALIGPSLSRSWIMIFSKSPSLYTMNHRILLCGSQHRLIRQDDQRSYSWWTVNSWVWRKRLNRLDCEINKFSAYTPYCI